MKITKEHQMKITKEHLKSWGACADGYRWFLSKFPDGGDYADIHQGLLNDNRPDDVGWLTGKMYQSFFGTPELPRSEASAGNAMIETLNNMDMPTVESISEWGGQQASSGDRTKQESSGDWTKQASSGNRTKQASSGRGTQQASSGDGTWHASSGDWTRQASSGIGTKHLSAGAFSKVAASGSAVEITASGNDSVVAAADCVSKIVLGEGGCAAVAYPDGDRIRFAVAYVGENGIKAGVAYTVNENGEFIKLEGE